MSSEMAVGLNRGPAKVRRSARGDESFEAFISGQAQQDAGVVRIVFDDQ